MTDLLQRAFDEASKLSVEEQDGLAGRILRELGAKAPEEAGGEDEHIPGAFLRTARSLEIEGPEDWSDNLEDYLYPVEPNG